MRRFWLLGIGFFFGLLCWQLWAKQPYFFYSAHDFFQQAQEALRYGDNAKALKLAQRAHEREPDDWDLADFLAWRFLEAKHPREALDLFRQEWAARPAAPALQGQVQALEQLDQRTEALQLLETYLAAHPQDAAFLNLAAQLAARNPNTQAQALDYYERLYHLNPRDQHLRSRLLDLLIAAGRHADAIPLQKQVVAEAPDNPQALHQLALLYNWQRDYQAAVPLYQRLLDLEAHNQALRLEAAQNADAAHNLEQALAHYLQLYAQTHGQKEYALILARLWSQKGQHAEAAAVLAPLMDQHPSLEERRRYALELLLAHNYGQALKAYRQAWEAGDSQKETILNLARLNAQQKQFSAAAQFWDEARRRQLLNAELRREAALTYSYAHRYQDAVAVLAPVDRQDPKILLFLGQMHFYQKQWDQAAHYYQQYLERFPQDAIVREQLAQVLSFLPERLAEAARQFGQGAKMSGDPRLRLHEAAVLLQLAQNASDDPKKQGQASAQWTAAAELLQQIPADGLSPELLLEQGRLLLWLGDLEPALDRLEKYLVRVPQDRQAQLDKARTLIYLQRGAQAAEVLRRLPPESLAALPAQPQAGPHSVNPDSSTEPETRTTNSTSGQPFPPSPVKVRVPSSPSAKLPLAARPASPETSDVLLLFLEAALADRNWPEAQRRAWQLYLTQFPGVYPLPRNWTAARRLVSENRGSEELPIAARAGIVRALCHHPHLEQESDLVQIAVDLCVANLSHRPNLRPDQRRYYQASLLLLGYLLPRISHFDQLQDLVHRLPGIHSESPEYLAALHYFTTNLGRQGGKLQYLLQTLKARQEQHRARSPGDLIFLAVLASELGDRRTAVRYCDQALRLRPQDQRLTVLRLQALMAANDAGRVLKTLEDQPQTPENALALAQTYLARHQYEGAVAVLGRVPPDHPVWPQAQLLLVQAHRGQQDYAAALLVIQDLQSRSESGPAVLMAKAQVLEALHDRQGAQSAYEAVLARAPDAVTFQAAQARLARFRGDWAGAYRHFKAALQESPQDIELLNELEQIREQLRPTLMARNLPEVRRGERRPEEALHPWQFSRFDRAYGVMSSSQGSSRSPLPIAFPYALIPETTLFQDHNQIKALEARLSGSFWLSRVLPVQLALGFRVYQQHATGPGPGGLNLGLSPIFSQTGKNRTIWERAEASLALGPLLLGDKVKVTGELSGRRYWKNLQQQVTQYGQKFIPFPPVFLNTFASASLDSGESRNRLLGSLSLGLSPGPQTDLTLRYSRRDIFDQDPAIYPRLYQQVMRLDNLPLITLNQVDLAASHQFFPGLSYQGNVAQAFFSDQNQRFALYQGLRWQALNRPRMHLDLTPSYYLASYRQQHDSYFSPHFYQAIGVSLDFDYQVFQMPLFDWPGSSGAWSWLNFFKFFRLPTLVLQTTGQLVDNDGRWGPALATLVGLETEPVQNLYVGLHYFYFKEWATNYWLNSLTFGMRWRF
jgi:tetratricopeptide (TPR) repeat protein